VKGVGQSAVANQADIVRQTQSEYRPLQMKVRAKRGRVRSRTSRRTPVRKHILLARRWFASSLRLHRSSLPFSLILCCLLATMAVTVSAQQPSDEFLRGYISSILERELQWERGSYVLKVDNGVATLTLAHDAQTRKVQAAQRLERQVEGVAEVRYVIADQGVEPPGFWRNIGERAARSFGVTGESDAFPVGDVFEPLLADEKQPRFSASLRHYYTRGGSTNVAAVGYGERFGLLRIRGENKGEGLQFGIIGGLFAQFDLGAPSSDLINADYTIGGTATYRQRANSYRLRFYHQSSHLGDEFVLRLNPTRINLSYESLEFIYSRDWGEQRDWADHPQWRGYAGGEYFLRRDPSNLGPASVHAGLEYYGNEALLRTGRLVAGLDVKSYEENDWKADFSLKAGLEFGKPGPLGRTFRILGEGYRGFSPHGQFYNDRIRYFGVGLYLGF
jgi:Protein of unknown function (DUF1207)